MNYFITGFPGTGKSTVARMLKKRGHIAYDPQAMRGYTHVESRTSGKHITAPSDLPRGWYDTIGAFNWNIAKMQQLLDSHRNDDIFICSMAHNESELLRQFEKIFVLTLDDNDLITRLKSRQGKTIGKTKEELSDILTLHRHYENSLIERGGIVIDVGLPVDKVIDIILSEVAHNSIA